MSEKNLQENEDPIWQMRMQMLTRMRKNMEIGQIIDEALFRYYSDKGESVPNWRVHKDPDWWIEYLKELKDKEK